MGYPPDNLSSENRESRLDFCLRPFSDSFVCIDEMKQTVESISGVSPCPRGLVHFETASKPGLREKLTTRRSNSKQLR